MLDDAREGRVEELFALARESPERAYRWLLVAKDFGHEEAEDYLALIEEAYDEFKYDDDASTEMSIHLALTEAYLRGLEGLPVDALLALAHFEAFLDGPHPSLADARARHVEPLLARLDPASRAQLETAWAGRPYRAVVRRVKRLEEAAELVRSGVHLPALVIEQECERLRREVEEAILAVRALRSPS